MKKILVNCDKCEKYTTVNNGSNLYFYPKEWGTIKIVVRDGYSSEEKGYDYCPDCTKKVLKAIEEA